MEIISNEKVNIDEVDEKVEIEMQIEHGIDEKDYAEFCYPYRDALNNIYNRIEILNQDYRRKTKDYAIHNTQKRIKKLESSITKLERKGHTVSLENIQKYIKDIAGLRIICYFEDDIYQIVKLIKEQTDIEVLDEEDYIKEPKKNGYKSYHMILGVPVYYIDGKHIYPVEVQIRTIGMDFWASMEHRICYKKEDVIPESIQKKFFRYSEMLSDIERKMSSLNDKEW